MYNVKVFKYPAGWQVRVYSTVVGFHERPDKFFLNCSEPPSYPLWDDTLGEYVYERVSGETWFNPFTLKEEKVPMEFDEDDVKRKKLRSISSSMNRTVNAVYKISRANVWDWFVTLTFDPDKVDSFDYQASVSKLKNWIDRMRRDCSDMGYVIVPEKHVSGRYHFHGLFRDCDGLGFVDSGHKGKDKEIIYNVGEYKLGWSTATMIKDQSRVVKYIAKYINKDLCSVAFGKRRYWCSRNLAEPEVQEVVLDRGKLGMLISRLDASATYVKRVDNGEVFTTYYELPKEVTLDEGF